MTTLTSRDKAQKCGKYFGGGILVGFLFPSSDIWILIWLSGTSPVSSAGLTALLPNTFTVKLLSRLAYTHPLPSHLCILACHWFWLPCRRKAACQTAMPSVMLGEHSMNSIPSREEEYEILNAIYFFVPVVENNVRHC